MRHNLQNSRLVGRATAVLSGSGEIDSLMPVAFYYNAAGNVVQSHEKNILGGYNHTYYRYSITEKPLQVRYEHTTADSAFVDVYYYTYDCMDRVTSVALSHDGEQPVTLCQYIYDELGRLSASTIFGNANQTNYTYNLRGWTTKIDSPGAFREDLIYFPLYGNYYPSRYNGDVSVASFRDYQDITSYTFTYGYDDLDRLTSATFAGQNMGGLANYSTTYQYDDNYNMTAMQRYGVTEWYNAYYQDFGLIDDLSMTYNGNQLKKVTDQAAELTYAGSMDFKDGANKATEYTWDANGNMTKDQNKGLTSISYNRLNLPARIVFQDGHINYYTYSYDGRKLATTYKIRNVNTVDPGTPFPIFPNGDGDDLNADILNGRGLNDSITVGQDTIITWDPETTLYTRYYSDNYIHRGNSVERILTPNGFMASDTLYAYIKDHQGNVRAVIDQTGRVVEVNHYYPYGMLMTMLSMANEIPPNDYQTYKYGTKELNRENGLDLYDSYARWYDPALPGTTGQDPKAEDYTPISPYTWCAANPVSMIDFNGEDGVNIVDDENKTITVTAKYFVVTQDMNYRDTDGQVKTLQGYNAEDIQEMNDYNGFLNALQLTVTVGDYKGYSIKFDLQFTDGGTIASAELRASQEVFNNMPIGNTIRLGNSQIYKNIHFSTTYMHDGTTTAVGGVTNLSKNIYMNVDYDTKMNRLHEIFHTLGFSHPKGKGGSQGIMYYPPQNPSKKDANEISLSKFLPFIK